MHTIFKFLELAYAVGVVGVFAFFIYIQAKELRRRLRDIDARYNEDIRKIREDGERKRAEIDAEYAAKRVALEAAHAYEIRKIWEDLDELDVAASLSVGDWIVWVPLMMPIKEHCGQIIETDSSHCCFKIRHLIDGQEVEDWHRCSRGAKMYKTNALDIMTREVAN